MSKLYNEEIKERFLSTYTNEATRATIRNVFAKTQLVENVLDKDIYDMNLNELGKCIENTVPFSINVAKSTGRFLSSYISFCTENGYRNSNINPLKSVDDNFYEKWIDQTKKIHFSLEEFHKILEVLDNYTDKALLYCFWEGISGERFSEIQELKIDNVNEQNNTVYIKQRDYHMPVSDECIKYLQKAHDEKTYYQFNQKSGEFSEKELIDSPFIFKNVKSPRSTEGAPIGMSVLYNRIHSIKEICGLEHLVPNSLKQSGQIKMAADLYKEDGIIAYDQFAKIGKKYSASLIENNGYTYYNSYLLREYITEQNIKELYGIDVEFAKK